MRATARALHHGLRLLAAGAVLAAPLLHAQDPLQRREEIWMAVSDAQLEQQRGGFDLGAGLLVGFGITRAVYVNGELQTQTTLDFGSIKNLTPVQASVLSQQLASLNLVQIGPGNTVPADLGGTFGGTIVQNTLNGQRIGTHTIINAQSNGMSLLKDLNTATTLNEGIARAVGGR